MAKRVSGGKTKRTTSPRAKAARRVAVFPRRAVIGGILGVLSAGLGIGGLLRSRSVSAPAVPPVEPPQIALAQPSPTPHADPLMEESPLPTDVYVAKPMLPPVALPVTPPAPPAAPPIASATPGALIPPPPFVAAPPKPAVVASSGLWERNARPFVDAGSAPVVAIVIDDLGLDHIRSTRTIGLDPEVTLAFMTYAERLPQWLAQARAGRHELLVHVPMQPESPHVDPGPNALTISLSETEILSRLRWGLDRMEGYVGANNHMGSRFTEDGPRMTVVLEELKARGLLFLDSRTTPHSACGMAATRVGLPFASRNVFLDNDTSVPAVRQQIEVLEAVARKHGTAIGIGHPHDGTLTALAEWLPIARSRGIIVAPLTTVMRHGAMRA